MINAPPFFFKCGKAASEPIHHAPKVRVKQSPAVGLADFVEPAINRDARVVHPCVNASEALDSGIGDLLDGFTISHIRRDCDHLVAI
ncbi:MAG TPA: hypothetical protein VLI90_19410 [Tepidisphaeraceae bacterium]|nr:hypothetical protein [Tepidisphaeraceae bacterium]